MAMAEFKGAANPGCKCNEVLRAADPSNGKVLSTMAIGHHTLN